MKLTPKFLLLILCLALGGCEDKGLSGYGLSSLGPKSADNQRYGGFYRYRNDQLVFAAFYTSEVPFHKFSAPNDHNPNTFEPRPHGISWHAQDHDGFWVDKQHVKISPGQAYVVLPEGANAYRTHQLQLTEEEAATLAKPGGRRDLPNLVSQIDTIRGLRAGNL